LSCAAFFAAFFAFLGNPVFFFFTGLVPFFFDDRDVRPLTAEAIFAAAFPTVFAAVTRTPSAVSSCVSLFFGIEDYSSGNNAILRHMSPDGLLAEVVA
jgi:hypothetical protein